MKLVQNQKIVLPVIGKKVVRGVHFFTVLHENKELLVKMLPFQVDKQLPKTLSCFVRDPEKGQLIQDRNNYIYEYFTIGETYKFTVRNDFCDTETSQSYYELINEVGITSRLYVHSGVKLSIGQSVQCLVTSITDRGGVSLSLEDECEQKKSKQSADLHYGNTQEQSSFDQEGTLDFIDAGTYHQNLEKIKAYEFALIDALRADDINAVLEYGEKYCQFCEMVFETNYKDQPKQEEKDDFLNACILSGNCFLLACDKYISNETDYYINNVMSRLNNPSFFKKEEKIKTAFFLLGLSITVDNINESLSVMRSIVHSGITLSHFDVHLFQALTNSFIDVGVYKSLDSFTGEVSKDVDMIVRNNAILLGLQLLIADELKDATPDLQRQMHFFKCIVPYAGTLKDKLMAKSFESVTCGLHASVYLSWNDLLDFNPQILAAKITNTPFQQYNAVTKAYFHGNGTISISDGCLTVLGHSHTNKLKKAIVNLGPLKNRIQVMLPDKVNLDTNNIVDLMRAWQQVEILLDNAPNNEDRSRMLIEQTEVLVRLDGISRDGLSFICTIMDYPNNQPGILPISTLVNYFVVNPHSVIKPGEPVYIPAEVTSSTNKAVMCSAAKYMENVIRDTVKPGTIMLCKHKSSDPKKGSMWLSDNGYNIVTSYGKYKKNQMAYIEVEYVSINGYISGEVKDFSEEYFDDNVAFGRLIENIGVEYEQTSTDEDNINSGDCSVELHPLVIRDLMRIIEQESSSVNDFYVRFNVQSLLKLIAGIIEEKSLYTYYNERLRQMGIVRTFYETGRVSTDVFNNYLQNNSDLFEQFPALKETADLIALLCYTGKNEHNNELMKLYQQGDQIRKSRVAGLILTGNLLNEFNLLLHKADVRKAIITELNMFLPEEAENDIVFIGEESYTMEFKTSIVYPADNRMRPDMNLQLARIMSVIAGFLNAEGGDLYIGVNDQGVPSGLKNDIDYLGNKDKFDRTFRDNIRCMMGKDINSIISSEWRNYMERDVYVMHIPAYHEVVTVGGKVYNRQGTSTVLLDQKEAELLGERKVLRFKGKPAMPIGNPIEPAVTESHLESNNNKTSKQEKTDKAKTFSVAQQHKPFYIHDGIVEEWDAFRYLNYLDTNEYMLTDRCLSNPNIGLSIPLETDADRELIQLFSNGYIVRTSIKELSMKKDRYPYKLKNFRYEELSGVAVADTKSKILILTRQDSVIYAKVIDLSIIEEGKDICATGKLYTNIPFDNFIACIQVPAEKESELSRITENRSTNIGYNLEALSFAKENEIIRQLIPEDYFS